MLCTHCLPFAVQKSYEQMEISVFYLALPTTHAPESGDRVRCFPIDRSNPNLIGRKTEQVKHKPQTSTLSPDEAEILIAESEVTLAFSLVIEYVR